MSDEILDFLVRNKDRLFDSNKLLNISEAAVQFCSESGRVIDKEIIALVGLESHVLRALDLV